MADHNKAPIVTPSFNDALDEVFLTEKQLAGRHQCAPKTLRNNRGKGRGVPFFKNGRKKRGHVRYQLSIVLAYERARRVTTAGSAELEASLDPRAEKFLTEKQLATRHQRCEKTLRNDRLSKIGMPYYKFESSVRYALSDVLAYERAHTMTSTSSMEIREAQRRTSSRSNVAE
jgi:hypothetical protein